MNVDWGFYPWRNDGESSWIHQNFHVEHQTKITTCFATSCWAPMIYKVELGHDGSCQKTNEHDDFCLPKKLPVSSVWNRNVWWCVDLYYIILHNTRYVFFATHHQLLKTYFSNWGTFFVALFSPWVGDDRTAAGFRGSCPPGAENNRTSSLGQKKQPQPTLMVTGTMVKCMG